MWRSRAGTLMRSRDENSMPIADADLAFVRRADAGDGLEQRGLAAARRSEEAEHFDRRGFAHVEHERTAAAA